MNNIKLLEQLNTFLKENNAYEAWYERYRLDNLMYADNISIEKFIQNMIDKNMIDSIFYHGIAGTTMTTMEGDEFLRLHKKCDIKSNGFMAELDIKWIDLCKKRNTNLN